MMDETLGRLEFAAERQLFAVVTGDSGTGKTTTIRRLKDTLDPAKFSVMYLGQSELWDKLQLQAYAAIRQRIDLQCKLPHLDRVQVEGYIKRHLEYAGANHDIFSDGAIDEIYHFSSGAARLVNKVCTHCLLFGSQNSRRIIDDHMVKLVIQGELS